MRNAGFRPKASHYFWTEGILVWDTLSLLKERKCISDATTGIFQSRPKRLDHSGRCRTKIVGRKAFLIVWALFPCRLCLAYPRASLEVRGHCYLSAYRYPAASSILYCPFRGVYSPPQNFLRLLSKYRTAALLCPVAVPSHYWVPSGQDHFGSGACPTIGVLQLRTCLSTLPRF